MNIVSMKCNRIINPLGYHMDKPVLSWITQGDDAKTLLGCQVLIASEDNFENILYDTGKREDIDGIGYILDMTLNSTSRYYWRVHVWTEIGEIISPIA